MNVHQMRHVVCDLLGYIGARMLIIDEVHALLASTYRQQRILLNTMRYLANELRIPLACAGTSEAKTALTTDEQLADRFEAYELPLWQNDEAFLRLLASFEAIFPLQRRSDLTGAACRRILPRPNGRRNRSYRAPAGDTRRKRNPDRKGENRQGEPGRSPHFASSPVHGRAA
jgi:hypothetical protein